MCQVNVLQAKTELSKLLAMLEAGDEDEIVIARNGVPAARLVRWEPADGDQRIGVAKGLFAVPDDFDADDEVIGRAFLEGRE